MAKTMYLGNDSKCGVLSTTIMHWPNDELKRGREDNLEQLLYDAIPNLTQTWRSHDCFTQCLRNLGVRVLEVEDLLEETFESNPLARTNLINGFVGHQQHPRPSEPDQ